MEEQILNIIIKDSINTPDGEVTVLWYPDDTAKEITTHVMEFIEWLVFSNENPFFPQMDENNKPCFYDVENENIVYMPYVYNYWLTEIKNK